MVHRQSWAIVRSNSWSVDPKLTHLTYAVQVQDVEPSPRSFRAGGGERAMMTFLLVGPEEETTH